MNCIYNMFFLLFTWLGCTFIGVISLIDISSVLTLRFFVRYQLSLFFIGLHDFFCFCRRRDVILFCVWTEVLSAQLQRCSDANFQSTTLLTVIQLANQLTCKHQPADVTQDRVKGTLYGHCLTLRRVSHTQTSQQLTVKTLLHLK